MKSSPFAGLLAAASLALLTGNTQATDYYFDSNAVGTGTGTLSTPFKSLASMPTLVSGDVVKLARGSHWVDATIPVYTHVTIESYGNAALPKPILDGSRLVPYSDSVLNASETLQDPSDPDSGVITMHTSAGTIVYGLFVDDEFPLYRSPGAGPLDCTSTAATLRTTQRFWYESNVLKICRASLPDEIDDISEVRLITTERIINLSLPADQSLRHATKYVKVSGLDIRYANDAGVGGAQGTSNINYGNVYIENNDFRGIQKTSVCLCSNAGPSEYLTKGDKFDKLKVSGNRFYEYGREAVYIGVSASWASSDALPIEIVDNIFGDRIAARPYLVAGWRMDTDAGSEAVDIKMGNRKGLVARNVFLNNMKKMMIFLQSFDVEVSRNTIDNRYVPDPAYSRLSERHQSAVWHQFEAPPGATPPFVQTATVKQNSISNGVGSGVLLRGADGLAASLASEDNQIYLVDDGYCADCAGHVDGNSAFVVRAKTGFSFATARNVARNGKFAIHRFEQAAITPSIDDDVFRGLAANTAYCDTNLPSGALPSPECIAGTQDTDGDGVYDHLDNCLAVSNAGQADKDLNGIGDACDLAWQSNDIDGDGIYNTDDNCASAANSGQDDIDDNGIGDACDHGLTATYFNDTDTNNNGVITALDDKLVGDGVLTRIEPNIDFNYGLFGSPDAAVGIDYFSARFSGRLIVPAYTGTYTFCLTGDDGVRLWVDNVDLFGSAHWAAQDSVKGCATVSLTAGQSVPIKMEFFDLTEDAIAKLEWSWPGQAEQVVPTTSLYAQ